MVYYAWDSRTKGYKQHISQRFQSRRSAQVKIPPASAWCHVQCRRLCREPTAYFLTGRLEEESDLLPGAQCCDRGCWHQKWHFLKHLSPTATTEFQKKKKKKRLCYLNNPSRIYCIFRKEVIFLPIRIFLHENSFRGPFPWLLLKHRSHHFLQFHNLKQEAMLWNAEAHFQTYVRLFLIQLSPFGVLSCLEVFR